MDGTGRTLLGLLAALVVLPIITIAAISGGGGEDTTPPPPECGETTGSGQQLPSGVTLTAEMLRNARIIVQVADDMEVADQGAVVALTAALVESELINTDSGDLDSLGLFQQRPSQGWGTEEEIMDPAHAATSFYDVLLATPGWLFMLPGYAAQAVQRSAYPDRYAERVDDAATILATVNNSTTADLCAADDPGEPGTLVDVPAPAGGLITVDASIEADLTQLLAAAEEDGIILGGGGYRSPERQIELREQNCGPTEYAIYQMPASFCTPPTARPGSSLHEVGLAIDFTCGDTTTGVSRGDACDTWLMANAADHGLLNLPSEAWHYSTTGG